MFNILHQTPKWFYYETFPLGRWILSRYTLLLSQATQQCRFSSPALAILHSCFRSTNKTVLLKREWSFYLVLSCPDSNNSRKSSKCKNVHERRRKVSLSGSALLPFLFFLFICCHFELDFFHRKCSQFLLLCILYLLLDCFNINFFLSWGYIVTNTKVTDMNFTFSKF